MSHPKRFRVQTRYHVWTVLDSSRDGRSDAVMHHFGARGRGDRAAREAANDYRDGLNDGYEGNEVSVVSADYEMGYRTGKRIRDDEEGSSGDRVSVPQPRPHLPTAV